MGLSFTEQKENALDGLNQFCYGAFRYSKRGMDLEAKKHVLALYKFLENEFGVFKQDLKRRGHFYSVDALKKILEELDEGSKEC